MMAQKQLLEGIWRLGWEAFKGVALLDGGHSVFFFTRRQRGYMHSRGRHLISYRDAHPFLKYFCAIVFFQIIRSHTIV